jgi:hypothetical protein
MKRKERERKPDNRIVMYQTPEQEKRLDAYCLAVMNKKGKVISGLKPLIFKKAIDEWLDKHEKDLNALDDATD